MKASSQSWRVLFVMGGILFIAGGSQHPGGPMVDMLADPAWFLSHATIFIGLLLLTVGLVQFRRAKPASPSLKRWLGLAIATTALETVEMGMHTMAYVDAEALAAGASTPVLTTHLWLAALFYPLFAIAMIGLIWVGQREQSLGSYWIGWIGILGATAHGVVMGLVFLFEVGPARILFPLAALLLSLWFILAGVWPARRSVPSKPSGSKAVGAKSPSNSASAVVPSP